MKDKASQKTEDEVLDQTFGGDQTFDGFDEDMTSQTQDQTQESAAKPEKKKSSGSSNTLLFVAGGVAAFGILGYMFVVKPMMSGGNQNAVAQSPASVVPPAAEPQVAPPVAAPVAPPPAVAQTGSPERQQAQDFLNGSVATPQVQQVPVVPPVIPVAPNLPTVATLPVVPTVPEVQKVPEVTVSNTTSSAVVEELGRRFDNQNQQFKIALDEVGNRVSNLEKFKEDQLSINKTVDDRLTKLEGGKVVKAPVVKANNTTPVVKKAVVSKPVRVKEVKEKEVYTPNILVDKTEAKPVKKEVPAVEYNVHSVYGGRVWLKNSDGSLSTFTSGDRLPSGEVIKNIDDEKFSIITDKRTIQKK